MNFAALDGHIADLQARLALLEADGLPELRQNYHFRVASPEASARLDEHDICKHTIDTALAVRAMLVEITVKVNAILAYMRTVDLPMPPAPPGDL